MNALLLLLTAANLATQAPRLIEPAEPTYPAQALADRIAATVQLRLDVDVDGRVEAVTVVSTTTVAEDPARVATSSVTASFAEAASAAARRLRFSQAFVDGTPVPFVLDYAYHFTLPPLPPPVITRDEPRPVARVRLRGVVREAGRRKRLAGALVTVSLGEEAYEAVTDGDGAFVFYDLAPGPWVVQIDLAGYTLAESEEEVVVDAITEVTYYLERSDTDGYDVIVEAQRVQREVTRRALATEAIVRVPGTLGDPVLVVENLPGVARTGLGGGNAVRGSSPQDSLTMVENIPVLIETHFGLRGVVAPQLVDRIDFVPGNFSVRYGRRTGGIVDVRLKRLAPDQVHGELDLSMLDVGLYLEAPITDELAIAFGARRSHVDGVLAALPEDDGLRFVAAPRYYDVQSMISWRPTRAHDFELFYLGSDERMSLLFDDVASVDSRATGSALDSSNTFHRLSARHRFRPSAKIENEALVAIGRDDVKTVAFGRFDFSARLDNLYVRDELDVRVTKGVRLIGGLDVHHQVVDFDITAPRPPKEGQSLENFDQVTLVARGEGLVSSISALYLEAELEVVDPLTLVPGVRADYYSLVEEVGFDPRITARFAWTDALTLRAGVGRVHQQPELDETVRPYGNPNLSLIAANHYAVGAAYKPYDFLSADLTLFYKDLQDVVASTEEVDVVEGVATPRVYDNDGRGRAYGAEVLIRAERHRGFEGWLSYTLSRAERTDGGAGSSRLFDYDQTHILTMVGTYHFGPTWSVGARWRYVSGRPTTPLLGGVWRAERDSFEAIPGAVNSSRLPAFHQLDLRVDKRWVFELWQLTAYLSLSNVYNRANAEDVGYNYDYTKQQNVSGLPLLPIFGMKGQF